MARRTVKSRCWQSWEIMELNQESVYFFNLAFQATTKIQHKSRRLHEDCCMRKNQPGNCHRDLCKALKEPTLHNAMGYFSAMVKTRKQRYERTQLPMLYPHRLVAELYKSHPDHFRDKMLGGSADNVSRFWKEMENHPAYRHHPVSRSSELRERTIPLVLHGDGVACVAVNRKWSKTAEVFSCKSALARGSTLQINLLIFLLHKTLAAACAAGHTWDIVFDEMAWSFQWLERGQWPDTDRLGQPIRYCDGTVPLSELAGGWCASLFSSLVILITSMEGSGSRALARSILVSFVGLMEDCTPCIPGRRSASQRLLGWLPSGRTMLG